MTKYKVDYKVTHFCFCSEVVEADTEEEAIKMIEDDYCNYEDYIEMDDTEFEFEGCIEVNDD